MLYRSVERRDTLPRRRVREHPADVAEAGRAEQRVGEDMADDVGVGMALEAARVLDRDAAEDERAALRQAVRIDRRADADLSQSAPPDGRGP